MRSSKTGAVGEPAVSTGYHPRAHRQSKRRGGARCGLLVGLGLALLAVALLGVSHAAPSPEALGVRRALLIGINDYENLPTLRGALNDVETLQKILSSRYDFDEQNIRVITDRQATRAGILQAFEQLAAESGPNDIVFVHYSGHGSQVPDTSNDEEDGMDETLCPHDARSPDVPDITDDELDHIVNRLKARWLVMSLDSCHSGTALRSAKGQMQTRFVPPDDRAELYAVTTRAVVPLPVSEQYLLFTGAAAEQSALDGPFGRGRYHGLFTYAFARALASAPSNATARDMMRLSEQEIEQIRPLLGGRLLPEPQLEGPSEFLDSPLIPQPGTAESSRTEAHIAPRLAYADVRVVDDTRLLLADGAVLGAAEGSIWAVYPPGEVRFEPGRASARIEVEQLSGRDAVGRVIEGTPSILGGSRAVLVAAPALTQGKTPLQLRQIPPVLHAQLARDLPQSLGDAVELLRTGTDAVYAIDCAVAASDMWSCSVFEGDASLPAARIDATLEAMAERIAEPITRSIVLRSFQALANPASGMALHVRAMGKPEGLVDMATPLTRGLIVTADLSPARLQFYQPGVPRSHANSLQLEVRSSKECYLTLVDVDSQGGVQQVFPNPLQASGFYPDGRIPAAVSALIPDSLETGNRAGFHLDYGPPAGEDTVRAFCMTERGDAKVLRRQIATAADRTRTRGGRPMAMRSALSGLGRELSRTTTRGLVITADRPVAQPLADLLAPQQTGPDWTAASLTLSIGQ